MVFSGGCKVFWVICADFYMFSLVFFFLKSHAKWGFLKAPNRPLAGQLFCVFFRGLFSLQRVKRHRTKVVFLKQS